MSEVMRTRRKIATALLAVVVAVATAACGDDIVVNVPTAPTPVAPTVPAPVADKYEFRVLGQGHRNVTVRHTSGRDGTTQLTTDLPYLSSFTSLDSTMFVSMEASAFTSQVVGSSPFLQIQIIVNGTVVREASSNLFAPALSISYTYRRP